MITLNETQLDTIIGGVNAAAFLKGFTDSNGSLFISGVRQSNLGNGIICTSKRHKLIENATPDDVNKALAGFKAQNMSKVVMGTGANSREFTLAELSKIFS